MDKIFISHRSTDKAFADIFVDFLRRCQIKNESIFCSSLPGNDIECTISAEIKEALIYSKLNIAILSDEYYKSIYCQNEAGIIWFNETKKILICLPEINDALLEGFLNNENKVRRLDNRDDLTEVCKIIKQLFPDFLYDITKLNTDIEKLMTEYKNKLSQRAVSKPSITINQNNEIEQKILNNDFSDDELIALRYLYETQCNYIRDDSDDFTAWKLNCGLQRKSSVNVAELFVEDGLAKYLFDENRDCFNGFTLKIKAYRELRKISDSAVKQLNKIATKHIKKLQSPENFIDKLIENGFSESELLFIKYMLDTERIKFLCGWQIENERVKIRAWEEINQLSEKLSTTYDEVLTKFDVRKLIEVSATTNSNNPKEYKLKNEFFNQIQNLNINSKVKLEEIISKYFIDNILEDLPF